MVKQDELNSIVKTTMENATIININGVNYLIHENVGQLITGLLVNDEKARKINLPEASA